MESILSSVFFLVLMVGVFYFFLIRPERKRRQRHQEMISQVSRGDKVVTMGGICGVVKKVENDRIWLEVQEGVVLKLVRDSVAERDTAANRGQQE